MTGKVALITGASRGIGLATAKRLASQGFRIAIHYNSGQEKAEALAKELPGSMPFRGDLGVATTAEELVKAVKAEMGSVDVLVNNAGVTLDQVLAFTKPDDFDRLIAINLKPIFLLSKFASRQMIRQKSGRIVNMSSVVGYSGNPGQSVYAATKAAIAGFAKSIAVELAPFGITVNTIAPGLIETDMTSSLSEEARKNIMARIPLGRAGRPEDIAGAVSFLVSDDASFITGTTLHVNGGMYLA